MYLSVNTVLHIIPTVALKSIGYEFVGLMLKDKMWCDVTVFLPFFLKQPDLFETGELLAIILSLFTVALFLLSYLDAININGSYARERKLNVLIFLHLLDSCTLKASLTGDRVKRIKNSTSFYMLVPAVINTG